VTKVSAVVSSGIVTVLAAGIAEPKMVYAKVFAGLFSKSVAVLNVLASDKNHITRS